MCVADIGVKHINHNDIADVGVIQINHNDIADIGVKHTSITMT
jgi:hypothetical protein